MMMKTMTCRQLGGACEQSYQGDTLQDLLEQNKLHMVEMMMQQDEQHIEASRKVKALMQDIEASKVWYANKQKLFNELPED
ncbi:hypothetical protein V5290_11005 [Psychromonas arctica]